MRAIHSWSRSVGEAFHVVSPSALTLCGYAEAVAHWFGQEANLRFVSWEELCRLVPEHVTVSVFVESQGSRRTFTFRNACKNTNKIVIGPLKVGAQSPDLDI